MAEFDWDLDNANKYRKVLFFEMDGAFTFGHMDKKKREKVRECASRKSLLDTSNVEWWVFRIFVTKSKKNRFDVDNVPKIIIDAFSKEQITTDKSAFKGIGLYKNDTIDYVRGVHVAGERVGQSDSTKVEIFGLLRRAV
jgi:Holliday junction resolvase RusA-like endonuclease